MCRKEGHQDQKIQKEFPFHFSIDRSEFHYWWFGWYTQTWWIKLMEMNKSERKSYIKLIKKNEEQRVYNGGTGLHKTHRQMMFTVRREIYQWGLRGFPCEMVTRSTWQRWSIKERAIVSVVTHKVMLTMIYQSDSITKSIHETVSESSIFNVLVCLIQLS